MGTSAGGWRAPEPPRVRHLTGPGSPPWYVRHERVVLLAGIVLFAAVALWSRASFIDEASYRYWPAPWRKTYEYSYLLFPVMALVVLARRRIVGAVRERLRLLDDVHARGGGGRPG